MTEFTVKDIFSSIQGEGSLLGTAMNFIRFSRCNLSCSWCDTDFSGGEQMGLDEIVGSIAPKIEWVSLTGGEPMLEKGLFELIGALHELGHVVYLETNGTIFDEAVFSSCDFVSLDLKPPSSKNPVHDEGALSYCLTHPKKTHIKVVIKDGGDIDYFLNIFKSGESTHNYPNWILQPEWDSMGGIDFKMLLSLGRNVRVIPQTHKVMKIK